MAETRHELHSQGLLAILVMDDTGSTFASALPYVCRIWSSERLLQYPLHFVMPGLTLTYLWRGWQQRQIKLLVQWHYPKLSVPRRVRTKTELRHSRLR